MVWSTPYSYTDGTVPVASQLNTHTTDLTFLGAVPLCNVYQTSGTLTTTSTPAAVPFDAEELDTLGFHSTSSNTSRITVPTGYAGRYQFLGQVYFASSASGGYRTVQLCKNGAVVTQTQLPAVVSSPHIQQVSFDLVLAVADYVEMFAANSVGNIATVVGSGGTFLHCRWVSNS